VLERRIRKPMGSEQPSLKLMVQGLEAAAQTRIQAIAQVCRKQILVA